MNFYIVTWLSNADIVLALLKGSFKFDQHHAPQKSIFLFVTVDKRLWISHEILVILVLAVSFNKFLKTRKSKNNSDLSILVTSPTSSLLVKFIAFTVHYLNDRAQTVNWISPGAALSGFSRYTQQHLFLCPRKWDCLWAHECLCITFFSCVYWLKNKQ